VAPSTGGGQGFFGQGNGSGAASAFRGKTAQGTVTSVAHNSNGSVTATIKIAKLPAGVTAKYVGIARINAGVLATNVIIIPTAAIKGSGSNATVEVLTNGSTSTRKVVVGKQTQAESEIVSGLAVGDNLIYMRTFQRGGGFRGGFGSGSGQGMFHQSGGQSTSGASGT
jgi:macrolide-specific efflux system membrane fusion protein